MAREGVTEAQVDVHDLHTFVHADKLVEHFLSCSIDHGNSRHAHAARCVYHLAVKSHYIQSGVARVQRGPCVGESVSPVQELRIGFIEDVGADFAAVFVWCFGAASVYTPFVSYAGKT